jgi:hypothetical protein
MLMLLLTVLLVNLECIFNMSYLDIIGGRIQFSVLVGTESVEVKGGDRIIGKWQPSPREWPAGRARTLSEEFLNCSTDAQSVLRFTKKYGPLGYPFGLPRSFEFALADWRKEQTKVAIWWDMFASFTNLPKTTIIAPATIEAIPRDQFQIGRTGLTFRCANLLHFMSLEIAALPVERLRRCQREGCNQRFVAHDLREKYCSELCKTKERNKAKLRYWETHKPGILAERKKERLRARRRRKNVTHKTS